MEDTEILSYILSIPLTALCYCYLPLIIRFFCGKLDKKKALTITIINGIVVQILIIIFASITNSDKMPNGAPMLFWGCISYSMLKKNNIINDLYDTFPKVLPAYSNNKKLGNKYIENLEFFIENDKLLYKINPYNNEEITDYDDIREYYKDYLSDKVENQQ